MSTKIISVRVEEEVLEHIKKIFANETLSDIVRKCLNVYAVGLKDTERAREFIAKLIIYGKALLPPNYVVEKSLIVNKDSERIAKEERKSVLHGYKVTISLRERKQYLKIERFINCILWKLEHDFDSIGEKVVLCRRPLVNITIFLDEPRIEIDEVLEDKYMDLIEKILFQ